MKEAGFMRSPSFLYRAICVTTLVAFSYILYSYHIQTYTLKYDQRSISSSCTSDSNGKCDLFKGRWIQDHERGASLYTNYSCKTIPQSKNCLLNGRQDKYFLDWRWKPDRCELPRFRPEIFLSIVQGKTMAFVGDSVARNQMESLLCLLSMEETPQPIQDESEDRSTKWEFPKYNFTLMALWSRFLVEATEQTINGSSNGNFNLTLDKVDKAWSKELPVIDYLIFSDTHWFIRPHLLFQFGNLIGGIFSHTPNITYLEPGLAIRKAFRTAFQEVNNCKNCKRPLVITRTFSPSQFEKGEWNSGGVCNRTLPIDREEVSLDGPDWEYRRIQMEEMEIAKVLGGGSVNKFELLDVTEMMLMRPDGHPGVHWKGKSKSNEYRDCVHWCLPGPIDTWNELLLEVIRRRS